MKAVVLRIPEHKNIECRIQTVDNLVPAPVFLHFNIPRFYGFSAKKRGVFEALTCTDWDIFSHEERNFRKPLFDPIFS